MRAAATCLGGATNEKTRRSVRQRACPSLMNRRGDCGRIGVFPRAHADDPVVGAVLMLFASGRSLMLMCF